VETPNVFFLNISTLTFTVTITQSKKGSALFTALMVDGTNQNHSSISGSIA